MKRPPVTWPGRVPAKKLTKDFLDFLCRDGPNDGPGAGSRLASPDEVADVLTGDFFVGGGAVEVAEGWQAEAGGGRGVRLHRRGAFGPDVLYFGRLDWSRKLL